MEKRLINEPSFKERNQARKENQKLQFVENSVIYQQSVIVRETRIQLHTERLLYVEFPSLRADIPHGFHLLGASFIPSTPAHTILPQYFFLVLKTESLWAMPIC